ncbi:hypothetical protein [Vibrio parahaemolyticus]|uniref:hypothetical protein n=1 Tax=Vibrio parahaemolyticus TaxID=670 RepID=UPI00111CEC08|nr:hypothetical protein [Vibrio parahaemolyticus]HCE4576244.1 hypothetical protein [Vibrio parahaemolyticus]HCG7584038.1 hypothetical protein [Vibrio parahaemolyticus]HCG7587741.1 hypothetical protein [Vibrio parahaemolyticus]
MSSSKRIICKGCAMKRVPFRGSKGRPTKFCKECKGGIFWTSSFGQWFLDAAMRQSSDSMPLDDNDIKDIFDIWKRRRSAQGTRYEVKRVWDYGDLFCDEAKLVDASEWTKDFDYHLCHLDPVTGEGFQGRLTARNLVIAPAKINQSLGNAQSVDHGFRVYTNTPTFKDKQAVKAWCTKAYDIASIANELQLKPKSKESPKSDIRVGYTSLQPSQLFVEEMQRLTKDWKANHINNPSMAFEALLTTGVQSASYIEHSYGEQIDLKQSYEDF